MREAFEKVKAIIDGWDPVDLLTCCHCPSDEYDDISIELAQMLTFDTDVETLKNDIYNIFVRDFDAGTFDKSPQECETIARKIIKDLQNCGRIVRDITPIRYQPLQASVRYERN